MRLTHKQALITVFTLLDDLHDQIQSDTLLKLLRDMNPFIFTDHTPADPAIWDSWINCKKKTNNDALLTPDDILKILRLFLQLNEKRYGYNTSLILKDIQLPAFQNRWKELLEKASKLTDI